MCGYHSSQQAKFVTTKNLDRPGKGYQGHGHKLTPAAEPTAQQHIHGKAAVDDGNKDMQSEDEIAQKERGQGKEKRDPPIRERRAAEQSHRPDGSEVRRVGHKPQNSSRGNQAR